MLCNLIQTKTIETGRLVVYFHERFSDTTIDSLSNLGYSVTTGEFIDYSANCDFSDVKNVTNELGSDWNSVREIHKYQSCVDLR